MFNNICCYCCCCVQSPSHVQLFVTTWIAACQGSMFLTIFWSLPKFMSIELVMPSDHLILPSPPVLNFPSIRIFSKKSALCIRWPEYRSFSFGISPSNEYSGLISYEIDWFDLPDGQGTLKHLIQHHSSKVSILQCSAFLLVQLSYLYLTTRKIITLTIWTFVSKVMSLFFNILCRLVIVFLPRSNHLISSLQLTIHSDFRAQEEICHCFHLFPFSLP